MLGKIQFNAYRPWHQKCRRNNDRSQGQPGPSFDARRGSVAALWNVQFNWNIFKKLMKPAQHKTSFWTLKRDNYYKTLISVPSVDVRLMSVDPISGFVLFKSVWEHAAHLTQLISHVFTIYWKHYTTKRQNTNIYARNTLLIKKSKRLILLITLQFFFSGT